VGDRWELTSGVGREWVVCSKGKEDEFTLKENCFIFSNEFLPLSLSLSLSPPDQSPSKFDA